MQCQRCHKENAADSKFCLACGSWLVITCIWCASDLPVDSRFCNKCGQPVPPPEAVDGRFGRPAAYTPKHLAEKILRSRARLEGERKQVSILFADLKGSMELLADRDPEEARAILDPVLELMMEAVHRYEGTVNQVLGDGIMALFGAPLAHEDHAVRACYAALAMQSAARRHNEQVGAGIGPIRIRVGINSGEVVVRAIGSDLDIDYTAVGQATHLAARMEQLASPDTILLTADTRRLAEGFIQARPLGRRLIKGLAQPVEVFELTGAAPTLTRWQATVARGLGRFVGRESELGLLDLGLENAKAGRGQVVALVGEPGVGKSRLLWEFTHSPRTNGCLVLESGSAPFGVNTAYLPVKTLLKAYFQLEPLDDARKIREKVAGKLLAFAPDVQPALPAVLALLDVDADDGEWQALDPPERRQRILATVAALLVKESRLQPLCLVFEDLHWTDSETQAVLDRVVAALAGERLLLLVSYRPGYEHAWRHAAAYTELRLQRLPAARSEELLAALLGKAPSLRSLTRLLIEQTDGNPLFIEESVRTLVEMGTLVGEPGAFRLARPVDAIQVPPTVQVVLAARVDRLPPEEKSLLQIAAVIGRDVPYTVAREIADLSEDTLRRAFAHLQEAGLLCEAKIFPALEYTFKHSLTHEVAYQSLLQDRRRTLHAHIVDALERLYSSHVADQVDHLAHHALQGELWSKAVTYCGQAGAKAFARSVPRLAVTRFEEALRALEHLPQNRHTLEQALDLRLELRYSLTPLGEFRRILHELGMAEQLARQLGDQRRLGIVSAFLSNHYTIMGDLARGAEYGEQVLAIADSLGDGSLQVLAYSALSMVNYRIGEYDRAIALARRNVDVLRGEVLGERFGMAPIASVYARTLLAWSLAEVGELDEGTAVAEEAIRIAEAADHAHSICFACHGLGMVCLRRGDLPKAVAVLKRARELCEVADVPILFPIVVAPLASALAAGGRAAESLALIEEGLQRAVALGHPFGHWLRTGGLSEALLHAGRVDEASPLARLAVQITRVVKVRGGEAWALLLLADVASRQSPSDAGEAESCYREAIAIAAELGMRPLIAHCHLGLGKLYGRTGDRAKADEHLTTATTMYRNMDMRFWLEKAEAELGRLG